MGLFLTYFSPKKKNEKKQQQQQKNPQKNWNQHEHERPYIF